MVNKQLDMTAFHALLCDEANDEQLIIALRTLTQFKEPESVIVAVKDRFGVWSGWSM